MSFDLGAFLDASRRRVDAALDGALPPALDAPALLHEAMRYAVFSGGKRLRPALAFAAAEACGRPGEDATAVAVAAELVHAYSLVHDDLPCMDDADERRGRASVHVKFGEANAVLVGDALLPAAFEVLAADDAPAAVQAALARAIGSRALVGGQVDDLALRPEDATLETVVAIHERKTAALFGFALGGAALSVGASADPVARLECFARHYGLAFQAADDLLDADLGECSILLVLDPETVRARVGVDVTAALDAVDGFGPGADALRALARALAERAG